MKTIRRPISILLAVLMVVGMFTMVPISAGAAATNYYIIGSFNGWDPNDTTYELKANTSTQGEYMYTGLTVDANTGIKVIDNDGTYYPAGTDNDFKLNDAGSYDIYFNPNGRSDGDWKNGIYAEIHYVAKIGDTKYKTLEDAFAAAQDGNTITLLANCAGNGIKAPQGKFANSGLTVDFAGFTYTVDGETVGSSGTETNGFQLLKGNNITFKGGTITSTKAKILVQNYSDLTLLGMTLTLDNPNYTSAYTLSNNNGDVVIDSTTINANSKGGFAFDVCRFSSYPFVHVTVKGGSDIQGDVEISASKGDAKQGFSLTLEGGSMTGDIVVDASAQALVGEENKVTKADTFNKTAPEGFKWVSNEDGTASLAPIPYVAQIDETKKYETLADAFAAAQDGDTITLLANCTGDGIKVAKAKFATKGLTVNFNDHTYTVDGETVGSSGTETIGFQLLKGNKITFQNGTITGNSNTNQTLQRMIQNYSDLTLDNMTVSMVGRYKDQITVSTCNGKTVINNSTISAPDFTWAGYDDPAAVGAAALAVGTFSSYPSIDVTVEGDSTTINGDVNVSDSNNKKAFSLKLNGGKLNGKINLDENAKAAIDDTESTANVTKADSFTQKAPEGYKWVDNGDGTSTLAVANYVAQVGETKYESLEEALAAISAVTSEYHSKSGLTIKKYKANGSIKLLADCAGNGIVIASGSNLTIDFDGNTYDVTGNLAGSNGTETSGFQLLKDSTVTFENGTITSEKAQMIVQNYSNLTLNNMVLDGTKMAGDGNYVLSNNNGNVVINDTTIDAREGCIAFDVCRYASYPSVKVTVTGESKINGDVEVFASKNDPKDGFSLNLNGGTMSGKIIVDKTAAAAMANTPEKASVNKKNTFEQDPAAGYKWKDNGDGTSTLVKKLFTGHNITLRGDVSLNFFINTKAIDNYDSSVPAKVVFTYDGTRTAEVAFADATPASDGVIVATIQVPAAFMAHKIKAVVYYNGAAQAETDEYSIQQYAETLIADPAAYGIPAAKVEAVKTLMKEMLNYGAKAQTVFAGQVKEQAAYDDLTEKYDYHMASVTDADIQAAIDAAPQNAGKTATDLSTVKPEANATFYTASVVFLSESTLKIVFKVPGGSTITGYDGSQKNTYYWVQETDIAAARLDTLQEFTVGDATFYYSALDYAKVVLKNGNAAAQDLVSALYLYNQAANGYFGANA